MNHRYPNEKQMYTEIVISSKLAELALYYSNMATIYWLCHNVLLNIFVNKKARQDYPSNILRNSLGLNPHPRYTTVTLALASGPPPTRVRTGGIQLHSVAFIPHLSLLQDVTTIILEEWKEHSFGGYMQNMLHKLPCLSHLWQVRQTAPPCGHWEGVQCPR